MFVHSGGSSSFASTGLLVAGACLDGISYLVDFLPEGGGLIRIVVKHGAEGGFGSNHLVLETADGTTVLEIVHDARLLSTSASLLLSATSLHTALHAALHALVAAGATLHLHALHTLAASTHAGAHH